MARKKGSGSASGGGWWTLAVLAGAGLAAAGFWKQRRQQAEKARLGRALPPAPKETAEPEPPTSVLNMPEDVEISWIAGPAGSIRIAQRHVSAPAPILFVHGLGGDLEQWAPALASLGSGWRGIALDLPGHGRSDAEGTVDIDVLAASIGAVIDGLRLRRCVLVAHSQGTAAAMRYAGRNRHRVSGLLLVDPNGDQSRLDAGDRRSLIEAVEEDAHGELRGHFRQILGKPEPEVRSKILSTLDSTPAQILTEYLSAGFAYSPLADLDNYDGPVRLVLSPLNDLPYSLHRLRPQLKVAVLHNVGHWLMLERPDAFARLLDHFVDSLGGRVEQVN